MFAIFRRLRLSFTRARAFEVSLTYCRGVETAMMTMPSGKSVRTRMIIRNGVLDDGQKLWYKSRTTQQTKEDENMGKEPNFDLGGKPLKLDSGLALDPRIVRLVQALARYSAEQDFKAQIEK